MPVSFSADLEIVLLVHTKCNHLSSFIQRQEKKSPSSRSPVLNKFIKCTYDPLGCSYVRKKPLKRGLRGAFRVGEWVPLFYLFLCLVSQLMSLRSSGVDGPLLPGIQSVLFWQSRCRFRSYSFNNCFRHHNSRTLKIRRAQIMYFSCNNL